MKGYIFCLLLSASALCPGQEDPTPSLEIGAKVFNHRCTLCHGPQGMGEGILPIKIDTYPNTNLFNQKFPTDRDSVHHIVVYGGSQGDMSNYMPPMGNDLSWTETESVVDFVVFLRNDKQQAHAMLSRLQAKTEPSSKLGRQVFSSRCVLCHGEYGEGDGRMAKIIKSPPPANLTLSLQSPAYLRLIISQGGEALGRSPQMPPWGEQLSEPEIESLLSYLLILRESSQ